MIANLNMHYILIGYVLNYRKLYIFLKIILSQINLILLYDYFFLSNISYGIEIWVNNYTNIIRIGPKLYNNINVCNIFLNNSIKNINI